MENVKTHHRIILGDSRAMAEVKDESVHLVVTSPPYWQLKDYGHENQIGFNDTYEDYINNLNLVWNECYRVLHPGCRLCVNIGDQFARSVYYGRYKIIPIRTEIIKFCETIGFDYMGAIIWQKVTTTNTTGGATIMGSFPYPRNGIVKLDYEFILLFKKLGTPPKPTKEQKESSKLTTEEWNQYFYGHWNFSGERQDQHLAVFPEELPRRLIRMFSFVGDIVLDPFLGSGTTSLAARNLERNSIGYEINKDFLPIIKNKLNIGNRDLFGEAVKSEVIEQKPYRHDFKTEIAKLPYVFKDLVKFDKKVDPRQLRFGSKIDGKEETNGNLYSVKHVEAPDCVELDSGLKIRLLGVKPIKEKKEAAIAFLQRITKGQKVYLKFDKQKYEADNMLLAYLFLKNKTFINMHLIKNRLAEVDITMDYRAKNRLLNCRAGSTNIEALNMDEHSTFWESYEQVATYVLNQIADRFGVDRFEGKQNVLGTRSCTTYEVDAKGIIENEKAFLIIECRRYTSSRQNQEKIGALVYRIIDTGAKGGIVVSPLGLQKGAAKIAAAENIRSVILEEDSTLEHYVVKLLNELIVKPVPAKAGGSTSGPDVII